MGGERSGSGDAARARLPRWARGRAVAGGCLWVSASSLAQVVELHYPSGAAARRRRDAGRGGQRRRARAHRCVCRAARERAGGPRGGGTRAATAYRAVGDALPECDRTVCGPGGRGARTRPARAARRAGRGLYPGRVLSRVGRKCMPRASVHVRVAQARPNSMCLPHYISYKSTLAWPVMRCRATGRADERNYGRRRPPRGR